MSISNQDLVVEFTGNGSTTIFPFTFTYFDTDQVKVSINGISASTGFIVDSENPALGGSIVFEEAPAIGDKIVISRITPRVRSSDFIEGGLLSSAALDGDFDYLTAITQELDQYALKLNIEKAQWDANNIRIENLPTPVNENDASTKIYVDELVTRLGNLPAPLNPADNGKWLKGNSGAATWQAITNSDVVSYLGYTPANKVGDTFTGNVTVSGNLNTNAMFFKGDATWQSLTVGTPNRGALSLALYPTGVPTFSLSTTPEATGLFETSKIVASRWHEACPAIIQPFGNSTSVTNIGCAHTALGTATARTATFTGSNIVTRVRRLGFVSATTAGSFAGLYFNAATWAAAGNGFCLSFTFSTTSAAAISDSRAFYGLSSSVAAPTNVDPSTLTNCFGFAKLSTSQNLHIVHGGSVAQTPLDLGSEFPADRLGDTLYRVNIYVYSDGWLGTVYKGSIEAVLGSPQYSIHHFSYIDLSGGVEFPLDTTPLAPRFWRCNNATAAAIALDLGTITVEDLPHL